jgi:hypothetical protein
MQQQETMMIRNVWIKKAFGLCALAALFLASAADAVPSNRWRLQFSGASQSAGTIVLRFSPVGGESFDVEIGVPNDTSENSVARLVVAVLKEKLPSEGYQVERDDGEDVLIRRRRGAADFDLEIVSDSVEHVRINPDRE